MRPLKSFFSSNLKKSVFQNTFIQILGRGGVIFFSLLTTIVLTRCLGAGHYGNYVFLTSFWLFLVSLANWGTQIIGVREISKKSTIKEKSRLFASLVRLRQYLLIASLIIGFFSILFIPVFNDFQNLTFLIFLTVIFANWQTSFAIAFQAFLRFDWQVIVEVLGAGAFLLFLGVNFLKGGGLTGAIIALIMGRFLAALISAIKVKKLPLKREKASLKWQKFLWQEALPTGGLLFLSTSYDRLIDTGLLHYFQTAEAVGIYGLAYKVYSNLILPAYYLSRSLFPLFSKKTKEKLSLNPAFSLGVRWSLLGAFLIGSSAFALAPFFIRVLGGKSFAAAIPVLRILVLSLPFTYLNHIFGFGLIATGRQWWSFGVGVIALLWNLVGNYWLIPNFSFLGAAGVTVTTEMLTCLLSFLLLTNKKR